MRWYRCRRPGNRAGLFCRIGSWDCWSGWTTGGRIRRRKGKRYSGCAMRPICAKARSRPTPDAALRRCARRHPQCLDLRGVHRRRACQLDPPARGVSPASRPAGAECFLRPAQPRDRQRQDHHRPDAVRGRSRRVAALSRAVLRDDAAGRGWLRSTSTPTCCSPPCAPSTRPSTAACSGTALICDPRHYPSLAKPISPDGARLCQMARERVLQRYPFFRSTFFERRMLFARAPARCALRSAA